MRLELREQDGKRRVVFAEGDCGPTGELSLGGTRHRGEIVRYAGNPNGVARQMGAEPLPTEWTFDWSTHSLVRGGLRVTQQTQGNTAEGDGTIRTLYDAKKLVQSLCDDGNLIEVHYGRYSNLGILRQQTPTETRADRLGMVLEFEWIAPEKPAERLAPRPVPKDTISQLNDLWGDILTTVRRPVTMARSTIDDAKDAVQQVNRAMRRTNSIVNEAQKGIRSLDALTSGIATGLTTIITGGNVLRDVVDKPAGVLSQQPDDAKSMIEAMDFRGKTQRRLAAMRRRAALDRAAYRRQSDSNVLGVHQGREGEDLRYVAVIWYGQGQADRWREIARFNRLGVSLLTAGQEVVIPKIGAGVA